MHNKISVVLDSRETHLKTELTNLGIEFSTEQLAVGDVVFKDNQGVLLFICERKTTSDLQSSIMSGRYAEQRERLNLTKSQGVKVAYILENYTSSSFVATSPLFKSKNATSSSAPHPAVSGALENLVLYHNIYILPTLSTKHTAKAIGNIQKKLSEKSMQPMNALAVDASAVFVPPVLVQRKEKVMDNIFYQQLLLIPGVSITVAKVIIATYSSIRSLTNAYDALDTAVKKENMLADLSLGKKRLGKILSKRIYGIYNDVAF